MNSKRKPDDVGGSQGGLLLSNQLCFALHSCSLELTKLYRPLLESLDLTYPQYLVMLVLWTTDRILVKELGRELHLDSGTLTPLLKNLEKLGYVNRVRNPSDERSVIVSLTPVGTRLRKKALQIPEALSCSLGLSVSEYNLLLQDVIRLRDHIRKDGREASESKRKTAI